MLECSFGLSGGTRAWDDGDGDDDDDDEYVVRINGTFLGIFGRTDWRPSGR